MTTREMPRRLTPPAPVGSQLKTIGVVAPKPARPEKENDPDYLALVRQLPCLYCGVEPCGEAAHVRFASAAFGKASGLSKKLADKWALPLCRDDHLNARHAQHRQGEAAFWAALGINPLIVCERLHAKRGDLVAMRAVAIETIANREKK